MNVDGLVRVSFAGRPAAQALTALALLEKPMRAQLVRLHAV